MNLQSPNPDRPIAPPWLWFWAIALVALLPQILSNWLAVLQAVNSLTEGLPELSVPIGVTAAFLIGFDAAPIAVFLIGITISLLPGVRARRITRRYNLSSPRPTALPELRRYLEAEAPDLELSTNLGRMTPLAFVYSKGLRKPCLAICGGLARLWRSDKPMAKAILLHEIAHLRQGDTQVIGIGSPLPTALRLLPLLFAAFASALLVLDRLFASEIAALQPLTDELARAAGQPEPQNLWGVMALTIGQPFWFATPSLGGALFGAGLWFLAIALPPVLAVWSAELGADRFVAADPELRPPLMRALNALGRTRRFLPRRVLDLLTHPPVALRRWAVADPSGRRSGVLCSLLVPVAYAASGALLLVGAWSAARAFGTTDAALITFVLRGFLPLSNDIWVQFAAMAGLLLLWPMLAPFWARLISGAVARQAGSGTTTSIVAGLVVLVFAVSAFLSGPPIDTRQRGADDGIAAAASAMAAGNRSEDASISPSLEPTKPVFQAGEEIVIAFRGLAANPLNWVALSPPDAPSGSYGEEGTWATLEDQTNGTVRLRSIPAGSYVARLYLARPDGTYEFAVEVPIVVH